MSSLTEESLTKLHAVGVETPNPSATSWHANARKRGRHDRVQPQHYSSNHDTVCGRMEMKKKEPHPVSQARTRTHGASRTEEKKKQELRDTFLVSPPQHCGGKGGPSSCTPKW